MTPNTPIKTLIVEDMEVLTLGMCEVLETLPMAQVVATAGNTEEARRFLQSQEEIDLVIMDIRLGPGPNTNGIDL